MTLYERSLLARLRAASAERLPGLLAEAQRHDAGLRRFGLVAEADALAERVREATGA